MEQQDIAYSEVDKKSLAIPAFKVDKNTEFMLHNSKDLTPIQTNLLSELNIINQKQDWTINVLADLYDSSKDERERIDNISKWRKGMEDWRTDADAKISDMNTIVSDIKDKKAKAEFLKSCFNYILSGLISAASALGALWFLIDKLNIFVK